MALTYCDTRKVAEFAYPLLVHRRQVPFASELNREGIPLDASLLPSAAAIFPHLQPSVGVVRQTSAGIEIESRGPLAGMGAGPMLPVCRVWFVRRVASDRCDGRNRMATRAQSMNNLKQIALAAHEL